MKEKENYQKVTPPENTQVAHDHEGDSLQAQKLRELFSNSSFLGDIPQPDGYAYIRADCGDSIEVCLQIKERTIEKARFDTVGCGFTIACGNKAMEMAEGRILSEAQQITPEQIITALGDLLPASHFHCAELAAQTLKAAIRDYLVRGKESWKKLYRTYPSK